MRTCIAMFLIIAFFTALPKAQGVAANPTRPTFSDNAHPMARGHLELELGGMFYRAGGVDWAATPWLLKLGVADPFEFKIGGTGFAYCGADDGYFGYGNMVLFGKFRFLNQKGMRPAMAAILGVGLPTASKQIFGPSTDLYLLYLLSGKFGPMGWDINVGLNILGIDQDKTFFDIPAILTLSATIYGPLGVSLEFADYIPLSDQRNKLHLLGALTWTLHPRAIIDAAFVKGFGGAANWEVHLGFTATLAKLW
ncbi:MAG: hypothetical protein JRJ19_08475 [Deltaproteobacteria bacterium]|nr:hypothetical protein [Deltaproteobacteria bacterium]